MECQIIFQTARAVIIELLNAGIYYTEQPYRIYINGELLLESSKVIQTISNLMPDTQYQLHLEDDHSGSADLSFHTEPEFVTLNVKQFGAKGDGLQDDTLFIQTAIQCCPRGGRVLIPEGIYKVTSLFLKDNLILELSNNAILSATWERELRPILPGLIESHDECSEYNLGSNEGNPLDMFAGLINGINVSNVVIYGGGLLEGNASFDNWWADPARKNIAFRPHLLFLNHCNNVTISGIRLQNSPQWTVHPYFSDNLRFLDMEIRNPKHSPNTDGINPQSCSKVEIIGVYFSLGDDCIAVKSGKIYMGSTYKKPCEHILIRQCCMRDGHGAVVLGSEMSGGIYHLTARDCLFLNTDRGLRIKTRRGRGKDAILDDIVFENIKMDHVMSPFTINSYYFCDPDGHSEYVRSKEALPVDERTPFIKNITFRNIEANNCHVSAFYMYGLPEQRINQVELSNISITFAENAAQGYPVMMDDLEPVSKLGLYANNIKKLVIQDVRISGNEGETYTIENVDFLEQI